MTNPAEFSTMWGSLASCAPVALWGGLASCAPVEYRRNLRVANPQQVANLPHRTKPR